MGLLRNTAKVGGNTLLSRVLGLLRDVVFARMFGADGNTDAFYIAFKIPNFLRRLFAEGAFSQAFVPVLTEYKTQREHDEVQRLARETAGTLGAILLLVTLVGVVAAPVLVALFAPGYLLDADNGRYELTVAMLRVTFPYLLFISLTALAAGVLNTYGRFGVPAFTPVLLNLVLIAAALWLAPLMEQPVMALAWGVFVAGLAQLLFQLPFLRRLGFLTWPRWGWAHEGVRRIVKLMIPAIFGSSVAQINLLFDTLIASFLVAGSVSWLYFSDRLVEFPLGVFGIALATVILPALSQKHAELAPEQFTRLLDWALRWAVLIGLPATLGLTLLAGPLLSTIFQHGAFTVHDLEMARLSLSAYAIGLLGFILVKVLAPGFYARQDTATPVRIGVRSMLSNMVLNAVFVVPMVWMGIEGAHAGLALATSLAAFLNAFWLYRRLQRDGVYRPEPGWGRLLLQLSAACAAMVATLVLGVPGLAQWSGWDAMTRVAHLALWVTSGVGVYVAALLLVGVRPAVLARPR